MTTKNKKQTITKADVKRYHERLERIVAVDEGVVLFIERVGNNKTQVDGFTNFSRAELVTLIVKTFDLTV